jgi:replication factor A1
MEIKDIQPNQGNIDLVLTVTEKGDTRTFEKFGKAGSVCTAKVKDDSGEIKLTLWNEDIDKVKVGDKIHLKNGWCSEYQGEKQLSSGKFGEIEVLESQGSEAPQEKSEPEQEPESEPSEPESEKPVQEEESIE